MTMKGRKLNEMPTSRWNGKYEMEMKSERTQETKTAAVTAVDRNFVLKSSLVINHGIGLNSCYRRRSARSSYLPTP